MTDLSDYAPRLRPQPVHQRGLHVIVEPFDAESHGQGLWDALGGSPDSVNGLIRFFPNDDFADADAFAAWLDGENASGRWVSRVFRRASDGAVVGMASYMRLDAKNGSIEVGSVAHGPAMQRSPMATEAHYLMARHIFDDLGYRRYEWKCHNDNGPSHAAARRFGFTFEGVFRQHIISRGTNRDTAWYSMIDSEWPVIRSAFEAWLSPDNFAEDGSQKKSLATIREEIAANG